ncbi:MAG: hypothetical protein L0211_07560 [Planctomycetaceae bacterium]|nr:hypothetical protein [Planctomycetaceae bacterium]
MLTGKIIKLVHLPQQPQLPGARLAAGHNDRSYGILRDDTGREVFFSRALVAGLHGFDNLHRGQVVEFTLDDPFLRAASINSVADHEQPQPAAT